MLPVFSIVLHFVFDESIPDVDWPTFITIITDLIDRISF